jgi:hypothetical protein
MTNFNLKDSSNTLLLVPKRNTKFLIVQYNELALPLMKHVHKKSCRVMVKEDIPNELLRLVSQAIQVTMKLQISELNTFTPYCSAFS